jgi:hypothetical protein
MGYAICASSFAGIWRRLRDSDLVMMAIGWSEDKTRQDKTKPEPGQDTISGDNPGIILVFRK